MRGKSPEETTKTNLIEKVCIGIVGFFFGSFFGVLLIFKPGAAFLGNLFMPADLIGGAILGMLVFTFSIITGGGIGAYVLLKILYGKRT